MEMNAQEIEFLMKNKFFIDNLYPPFLFFRLSSTTIAWFFYFSTFQPLRADLETPLIALY
jgi:hypothetical protein